MLGSTGVELPVIGLGGAALMFGGNKGKGDERSSGLLAPTLYYTHHHPFPLFLNDWLDQ